MNDNEIKSILRKSKTIAMIGVSSEKKGEDRKNLKRKTGKRKSRCHFTRERI